MREQHAEGQTDVAHNIIKASGIFDLSFYIEQAGMAFASEDEAIAHFLSHAQRFDPHPLFSTHLYLAQIEPVPEGTNALLHYLTVGAAEGRTPHPLFDPRWYLATNPDVADAGADPFLHFLQNGARERRSPSADFDACWYLESNPDVASAGVNPLAHFLTVGVREGRDPSNTFQTQWYLETYPDVAASGLNPLVHYVLYGRAEGRQTSNEKLLVEGLERIRQSGLFDVAFYSQQVGDVFSSDDDAIAHYLNHPLAGDPHPLFSTSQYFAQIEPVPKGTNALLHYLTTGAAEGRKPHPLFDPDWYLATNPDVAEAGADPFAHFLQNGTRERRSPSADFDTWWYLDINPDVAEAGINPLLHYLIIGAREGRNPSRTFHTRWYLDTYPDVATSGLNPLIHYVLYGRAEGRLSEAPQAFRLDHNFGLPRDRFNEWLNSGRRQRSNKASALLDVIDPSLTGTTRLCARAPRFVTVLAPRTDDQSRIPCACTKSAIENICNDLGIKCKTIDIRTLADTLVTIPEDNIVLFLSEGDLPLRDGLLALVKTVGLTGRLCTFDSFFESDGIVYPVLQPGPNLTHLRNVDCTFSRFAIRAAHLRGLDLINGPRQILLAALDNIAAADDTAALVHCPAFVIESADLSREINNVRGDLVKRNIQKAKVQAPAVSVIICTKDKGHLLDQLLRHLIEIVGHLVIEVKIVSNQTSNAFALETLNRWRSCAKISVLTYEKSFNFSDQCNLGAERCTGDFLLFLNDDIIPIAPDWLDQLLAPLEDHTVGATGPLLLYPNERVQHAGMYLGHHNTAGHILRGAKLHEGDYIFHASAAREVSCVTGAVMLVRQSIFRDLNGFDDQLKSFLQDVDLCLRIQRSGYKLVYNPKSILIHAESASVLDMLKEPGSNELRIGEHNYFVARNAHSLNAEDLFHNPNFDTSDDTLRLLR